MHIGARLLVVKTKNVTDKYTTVSRSRKFSMKIEPLHAPDVRETSYGYVKYYNALFDVDQ